MATPTTLVTKNLSINNADNFVTEVQGNSEFYVFAAKHTQYPDTDATVPVPTESVKSSTRDIYEDLLFGKKITSADINKVIKRYDWTVNNKYAQYDDQDPLLFDKEYYASVNVGSSYRVYKCLFNNISSNSTVEPSGTDLSPVESPSDGYIWKYMYTASNSDMTKFATSNYMPITPNTAVTVGAVDGSIEVILVEEPGVGYDNYLSGEFILPTDLRVDGNPLVYGLPGDAKNVNGFYSGCNIKITTGAAVGQFRDIVAYEISGGKKKITLNSAFTNLLQPGDEFEITPSVFVFDTGGTKQANCIARAIVSAASGNSINNIEILSPGSGYRAAQAFILPDATVGVSANNAASLRPIMSPPGGHGSNIYRELNSTAACVATQFTEDESGYISTANDYRTIGVIKNPLYANVNLALHAPSTVGNFVLGEEVYSYTSDILAGTVAITSGSPTVSGTNTFFSTSFKAGDKILLSSNTSNQLATVAGVANNISMTISSNAIFTAAGIKCIKPYLELAGTVVSITGGLTLSDVRGINVRANNLVIGGSSFATSYINGDAAQPISINGTTIVNFGTFNQLTKFVGSQTVGSFALDELVYQTDVLPVAEPSARVHSFVENGINDELYVTNVKNIFEDGGTAIVSNTGGVFTLSTKYAGNLVKDSGDIFYIENVAPITRANNKSESVKLILEF
jgi:hypothetical protein